jgi:small-conductance mechanosensitive channel
MKTLNTWAVVKWGVVLLVYGLTLAICLDQIRERDAVITKNEAQLADLRSGLGILKGGIKTLVSDNEQHIEHLKNLRDYLAPSSSDSLDELASKASTALDKSSKIDELKAKLDENQRRLSASTSADEKDELLKEGWKILDQMMALRGDH